MEILHVLVRNTTARNAIAMGIFHGLCTYVLPVNEALSVINFHNVTNRTGYNHKM